MKTLFKNINVIALLAILAISCEDKLSTSPYDLIGADAAFQNVDDLLAGALGAYASISGQNIYAINALVSDNLRRADSNTGQGMQLFNHDIISSDNTLTSAWSGAYRVIDRANRVIEALELVEASTSAEVILKDQIDGEMHALRAYQHFELYRLFSDFSYPNPDGLAVPYMIKSVISTPSRLNKQEFFTQLLADLSYASNKLDSLTISNERMNKNSINGLLARISLYNQNWDDAIKFASDVINEIPLTERVDYLRLWNDTQEGEIIFKLPRLDIIDGTIDIFERSSNDDVFFYASNSLVSSYDQNNDIRFETFFNSLDIASVKVKKFNQIVGKKNIADIKMMRTSEMYLIRAEAYAKKGDLNNAENDINTLRSKRILGTGSVLNFSSQDDALKKILDESRLELVFEGHRYFDHKRAGLKISRLTSDIDAATTSDGIELGSKFFIFPIPQEEMFANKNMVQNPGY